ncbi:MAG: low molecular weight phosphotyrosine protein phosphatase [Nevskia sp.]|nr:low molecular weight phosphotyrosine protein phosphatase [Nevskia sp.]
MFRRILVVCTGNICRSPMAEALLRERLRGDGVEVHSAGVAALVDRPADPLAQQVMAAHGHDISAHRARQATQAMLKSMDLILALEQFHDDWIRTRYPQFHGRVHKLSRWRGNADIADPYGGSRSAFEQAYEEIESCVEDWARRLLKAA